MGPLGQEIPYRCWRWSDTSLEEAQSLADEAARQLAERMSAGGPPPNRYGYADRPLREEVIQELQNDARELSAAVTRNSYGCLVLNAARVMFIDVDFPPPQTGSSLGGWLGRLLGRTPPPSAADVEQAAVAKVKDWVSDRPEWALRVYRTRAGLRLLATQELFAPEAEATQSAMQQLGCDPLYLRLCRVQQSFRARLTPKPWRCNVPLPPVRFPYADARAVASLERWQERYQSACKGAATCRLVDVLGSSRVHAEAEPIIALHDQLTRIEAGLPLA